VICAQKLTVVEIITSKSKGKGLSSTFLYTTCDLQHFTILKVVADWHEL